ncbi:MAG: hypothetical protein WDO16_23690 [Bacteroidota bacterium]
MSPVDYSVADAVTFISKQLASRQVVMINEEHRMSIHRLLTLQLLKPLYKLGYRYIAVETLSSDSTLMLKRFPVLQTGTYCKDPFFAEMLRTAVKIGYQLVPYEINISSRDEYRRMDPLQRQVFREEMQAKNIINGIIAHDPKAKVIVHGGRGHIAEVYEMQLMGTDSVRMATMAGSV